MKCRLGHEGCKNKMPKHYSKEELKIAIRCTHNDNVYCHNCFPHEYQKPPCAHQWFKVRTVYRKSTPLDATCVMEGENMREGILLQCANDGCGVTKELYG